MPCHAFKTKDGLTGFVTVARRPRRRCSACKDRWATLSCDFPDQKRKSGTCDKALCTRCAVNIGPDLDHCPHHPADPKGAQLALEGL